jgi:hypothetical protein
MRPVTCPRVLLPLALTLLIAFVLPTTGHGDFFISAYNSTLVLTDHPNFYRAVADEPTAVFPTGLSGGPYGPAFYYPTAAWLLTLDKLHLTDIGAWTGPGDEALRSASNIFLLKLPNLAAYVLTALVLMRTWGGNRGKTAAALWLANPAVILFSLMMGQNDGWTALASITALFFALRAVEARPLALAGRQLPLRLLAMLSLAIGAAIKLSPVLLVLPLAWVLGRGYREKGLLAAVGLGTFAVLISPFLGTQYFWDHGLLGRQVGQVPDLPMPVMALLYLSYLGMVMLAAQRDTQKLRVLLLSFVAIHALLYLLPGWNPQRAVLFVAALSVVVPVRRLFLAPYTLVTALALVLALEHGNELASGLFEPLTARVLLIRPLFNTDRIEPLHSALLAAGGMAWLAALASLWIVKSPRPAASPGLTAMATLLATSLVAFLAASMWLLPDGVTATPYATAEPPQAVAAGDAFSFTFISAQDDLRAVTFWVEAGQAPARVLATDSDGRRLYFQAAQQLAPGPNRVDLGHIEEARGRAFRVSLTPARALQVRMAEVPPTLALSSAELNGSPLTGTAAYTLDYRTTWSGLLGDAGHHLRGDWQVLVASLVVCGAAFAGLGLLRQCASAEASLRSTTS